MKAQSLTPFYFVLLTITVSLSLWFNSGCAGRGPKLPDTSGPISASPSPPLREASERETEPATSVTTRGPTATPTAMPTSAETSAPPAGQLELVGQIGGPANAVAVQGNYAYVTTYSGLRVIDVSNPTTPVEVGAYAMPSWGRDVYVAGDYAYVAAMEAGLQVIDISNPAAPVEVSAYGAPGYATNVYVADNHAYMAGYAQSSDQGGFLQVIDVSNPAAPVGVSAYDTPGASVYNNWGVYITDGYAYLAVGRAGLRVVDVSNPAAPRQVGAYTTWDSIEDVHIAGNYAYLAGGAGGLQVVDVSNPAAPMAVGTYYGSGNAVNYNVYVAGPYAYVVGGLCAPDCQGLLQMIDVADPAAAVAVGAYDAPVTGQVYVADGYIYLAAEEKGLVILKVPSPNEIPLPTATPTPTEAPPVSTVPGEVLWEEAVRLLHSGQVVEAGQAHSLDVGLRLKDGTVLHTVEPTIDAIWHEIQKCGDVCAGIKFQTE